MRKVLQPDFFERHTATVAKDLLGKFLVRKIGNKEIALMITETEAYHGFLDKASHAHRGQTERNTPMFGLPGHIYVYFTYGIHWMLNLTCGKVGLPAAVLIRAAGDIVGPARLTKALSIDKSLTGLALSKKTGLWIEDRGISFKSSEVEKTPRIGIRYAEEWIERPWRFVVRQGVAGRRS
jgi:DNA-3-methyladenine glycosylase